MRTKYVMKSLFVLPFLLIHLQCSKQDTAMETETYCNPLNIDYTYMIYNSNQDLSYRSGADPAVVEFRGEYYMFVTRSMGYWHSTDLLNWQFIEPEKWYFEGSNAPAAFNYKDSLLYVTGNPSGNMSILFTDNPQKGDWKAVPAILNNVQDPALFFDDDDQAYIFWGSSNTYPIRGQKLNKNKRFLREGPITEILNLDEEKHGWERFGENHSDTVLGGYMEGAWLTKHRGKYYMQYAAPGTEFNVYADGVYIADHPLGPYTYQGHNPVSYKPGGFINGAGHGSTVLDLHGNYWHFASMSLSVNVNWERRLCMFPLFFDDDGTMYCDNRFGDYPHYAPTVPGKEGAFRGWMLLSYRKKVKASSEVTGHVPANITDENVKTYWLAQANDDGQWIQIDLEESCQVHAIQINYFDHQSNLYGRVPHLFHQYCVEGSLEGREWFTLIDKSSNLKDVPNDYVELESPNIMKYVRYKNIRVPTPYLAISGIRIFGLGNGEAPRKIKKWELRRQDDRRNIFIRWQQQPEAQGYNILWGISPDKLYSSWMVYADTTLMLKSLSVDQKYFFAIEAFNENGVSALSDIVEVE